MTQKTPHSHHDLDAERILSSPQPKNIINASTGKILSARVAGGSGRTTFSPRNIGLMTSRA